MKTSKLSELESVYKAAIKAKLFSLTPELFLSSDLIGKLFNTRILNNEIDNQGNFAEIGLKTEDQRIKIEEKQILRHISNTETTAVIVDELYLDSENLPELSVRKFKLTAVLEWEGTEWRIIHVDITPLYSKFNDESATGQQNESPDLDKKLIEKDLKLNQLISELEANRLQLVKQDKLASLGQLAAGIAHEIKNPLNFINNFSELSIEFIEEIYEELKEIETSPAIENINSLLNDIKHNLSKIYQHSGRVDSIVKSMLMHARGGNGIREFTDLNELISDYVNLAFHGMRANRHPINVDIRLKLDENVGKVKLNPEEFSRVMLNLCKNAFDAMREKLEMESNDYLPTLTISTQKAGDKILINVEDNGPGVSEEIMDKLLLPFFTTKKTKDGTGLGLSITHDIVKSHQGSLDISSKEGVGTVFKISLPVNL